MDRGVHFERTRQWAIEEGFSAEDARVIAQADWDVDKIHNVHEWRNKGYHFAWLGARRRAKRLLSQAIETHDLVALGEALHCTQDAIGHGNLGHVWHWNGIDRWEQRSDRVRRELERQSKAILSRFRDS